MKKITDKLYNWASVIDEGTLEQAKRASTMPFIYPHMALMPDAHLGIGATVGSVIPTEKAIIPAAVGVDIGCFVGETKVAMLNGTQRTLKDLAEEGGEYWVYSLDGNGKVVPGKATALKTRTGAELMKVVISGGDEIICTPDHPFMMKDGTYREAKDLKFNDSLMPLYRTWQTRDGYESVSTGKGNSRQTHVLVYEAMNGPVLPGHVVHHKNHFHFDNEPENLTMLTATEHSAYHRRVGKKFRNEDPTFQSLRLAGIERSKLDPEITAKRALVGTQNIKRYMEEHHDEWLTSVAGNGERGAVALKTFNTTARACSDCDEVSKNPAALRWHKHREHSYNHKVISISLVEERADVYCLQVPEYHNFALAAGVFVHNCGMIAVRTQYTAEQLPENRVPVREQIERAVPLSAGKYNGKVVATAKPRIELLQAEAEAAGFDPATYAANWALQLGTLGSGNHFIEITVDEENRVWLFLHSGSRGIGNKIASHHIKVARELMKREKIELPDPDLAYLTEGTPEFDRYISELSWAQHFALLNREEMMDRVVRQFEDWVGGKVEESTRINTHHNYTEHEEHFGRMVWLSRKGAIDASKGKLGLVPGSMGTASYVVEGLGNEQSLNSSPHGAGREYSRSKARKTFTRAQLDEAMIGIEWRHTDAFLDEIPMAYKAIDTVMEDSADLVKILHTFHQVVNVKGD